MSFTLNRKTDYALVALAALAREAQGAKQPLSARELAEQYDLPVHLLSNVLKELHQARIVCSKRGAAGGYSLCHDPAGISMLQIIEAMEGPVTAAECCQPSEPCVPCRAQSSCPICSPMRQFNDRLFIFLKGISLADLMAPLKESLVPLADSRSEP